MKSVQTKKQNRRICAFFKVSSQAHFILPDVFYTPRCPFFNREKRRNSLELEGSQLFEFLKQSTFLLDKSSPQGTFSLQNTISANFFRQRCV